MAAMLHHLNVEDLRLNYDPESPQKRFKEAGVEAAFLSESERLPGMVPWPAATKPTPAPLHPAPAASDDLSKFKGYDAVVVTWTAAEAAALAALFTPGFPVSQWYEYRHNVQSYIPLVTGGMAPFNDKSADMTRYYQSLGLYFPCRIGKARVLLMKSGLHLDYDGPACPLRKMITEESGRKLRSAMLSSPVTPDSTAPPSSRTSRGLRPLIPPRPSRPARLRRSLRPSPGSTLNASQVRKPFPSCGIQPQIRL
jgi:hypothetical protein